MKEELISLEAAKLAKEHGFKLQREWNPKYVQGYIDNELTEFQAGDYSCDSHYLAPTQSLLQKWLREIHNIQIEIDYKVHDDYINKPIYHCIVKTLKEGSTYNTYQIRTNENMLDHNSYEEALEQGLLHSLNLIK